MDGGALQQRTAATSELMEHSVLMVPHPSTLKAAYARGDMGGRGDAISGGGNGGGGEVGGEGGTAGAGTAGGRGGGDGGEHSAHSLQWSQLQTVLHSRATPPSWPGHQLSHRPSDGCEWTTGADASIR